MSHHRPHLPVFLAEAPAAAKFRPPSTPATVPPPSANPTTNAAGIFPADEPQELPLAFFDPPLATKSHRSWRDLGGAGPFFVQQRVAEAALWEKKDDTKPKNEPSFANRSIRFGVHKKGALQLPIFLFGLSLAIIGTVFFLQMEHYFVFGLFFAPVIGLIGWVLLAMTIVKRFGHEELIHQDGTWGHRVSLGPLSWGSRQVESRHPVWRIRVHGFRGAALELVGDDGILLMGSGATTLSRLTVEELSRLPKQFSNDCPPKT